MNSQEKKIQEYLLSGGKITSLGAFQKFNCTRLAARIHDLKSMGLTIDKEMIKTQEGKVIAEYSIKA